MDLCPCAAHKDIYDCDEPSTLNTHTLVFVGITKFNKYNAGLLAAKRQG